MRSLLLYHIKSSSLGKQHVEYMYKYEPQFFFQVGNNLWKFVLGNKIQNCCINSGQNVKYAIIGTIIKSSTVIS